MDFNLDMRLRKTSIEAQRSRNKNQRSVGPEGSRPFPPDAQLKPLHKPLMTKKSLQLLTHQVNFCIDQQLEMIFFLKNPVKQK